MGDVGPEPTGWELSRGIARIEQTLREQNSAYLPSALWLSEKAGLVTATTNQGGEIAVLRTDLSETKRVADESASKLEEQRSRNRLFVYGIIAAPLLTILVTWVLGGGLSR